MMIEYLAAALFGALAFAVGAFFWLFRKPKPTPQTKPQIQPVDVLTQAEEKADAQEPDPHPDDPDYVDKYVRDSEALDGTDPRL